MQLQFLPYAVAEPSEAPGTCHCEGGGVQRVGLPGLGDWADAWIVAALGVGVAPAAGDQDAVAVLVSLDGARSGRGAPISQPTQRGRPRSSN